MSSSEDEADVYHEAQTLTAPTMTVIERPNSESLNLIDNTSETHLIGLTKIKSKPLIPPTTNLTELQDPRGGAQWPIPGVDAGLCHCSTYDHCSSCCLLWPFKISLLVSE